MLSFVKDQHHYVMINPQKWMKDHQDQVVELNARNSDKFEELYYDKLKKFEESLDHKE